MYISATLINNKVFYKNYLKLNLYDLKNQKKKIRTINPQNDYKLWKTVISA